MEPETIAGHRFSAGRARFNRAATLFLILCFLNSMVGLYLLADAVSSGQPVSLLESHEPNVLSLNGQHARVAPQVYSRMQTYGRITVGLLALSFVVKLALIVVNARLPASASPDPKDELGPVRIADDGVAHSGGGDQWPLVLPRDTIERLELQYLPAADRPVPMVLCGALLALLGFPLMLILPAIEDFEMFAVFCLGGLLAGIGVWMIWLAFKKRYVLIAHTPNGPSRFLFPRKAARKDVIRFTTGAAKRHDYQLDFGPGLIG